MKHIILGAGGSIGTPLQNLILQKKEPLKLLSRSGKSVLGADSAAVNVLNAATLKAAIEPNSVVYMLVGLEYSTKIWRTHWLPLIQNVVAACQHHGARLVFFDNVYMYGRVHGTMTEETPMNPCSNKGEVRAKVAEFVTNAYKGGSVQGLIARSADFYGPFAQRTSVPQQLAFDNLAKGKKAQWLISPDFKHSYTYTLDAAESLYLLAKDESTWNQVWHVPTKNPALTGRELTALAGNVLGRKAEATAMSRFMLGAVGLFVPVVKEIAEMAYQNEQDYIFDSSKFEQHFNFTPTSYDAGVRTTFEHFYPQLVKIEV